MMPAQERRWAREKSDGRRDGRRKVAHWKYESKGPAPVGWGLAGYPVLREGKASELAPETRVMVLRVVSVLPGPSKMRDRGVDERCANAPEDRPCPPSARPTSRTWNRTIHSSAKLDGVQGSRSPCTISVLRGDRSPARRRERHVVMVTSAAHLIESIRSDRRRASALPLRRQSASEKESTRAGHRGAACAGSTASPDQTIASMRSGCCVAICSSVLAPMLSPIALMRGIVKTIEEREDNRRPPGGT